MKKLGLISAGIFGALLFAYGSISAMVNQGMSLPASILVFGATLAGGIAIVKLLGNQSDSRSDPGS